MMPGFSEESYPDRDPLQERLVSEYPELAIEKDGQVFLYHQTIALSDRFDGDSITGRQMSFKRAFLVELTNRNILALGNNANNSSLTPELDGQLVTYIREDIPQALLFELEENVWEAVQPLSGEAATIDTRLVAGLAGLELDDKFSEVLKA